MRFLAVAFSALLTATVAFSADLPALAGKYINLAGDVADLTVEEEIQDQEDLFLPKTFSVRLELESADGNSSIYLEESGLKSDATSKELTFDLADECDDPGCTSQEGSAVITLNSAGIYEIQVDVQSSKDVAQDMEETFGENGVYDETTIQKYCEDTYGPAARGYGNEWSYGENGHAVCEYTYTATLEKM